MRRTKHRDALTPRAFVGCFACPVRPFWWLHGPQGERLAHPDDRGVVLGPRVEGAPLGDGRLEGIVLKDRTSPTATERASAGRRSRTGAGTSRRHGQPADSPGFAQAEGGGWLASRTSSASPEPSATGTQPRAAASRSTISLANTFQPSAVASSSASEGRSAERSSHRTSCRLATAVSRSASATR